MNLRGCTSTAYIIDAIGTTCMYSAASIIAEKLVSRLRVRRPDLRAVKDSELDTA